MWSDLRLTSLTKLLQFSKFKSRFLSLKFIRILVSHGRFRHIIIKYIISGSIIISWYQIIITIREDFFSNEGKYE